MRALLIGILIFGISSVSAQVGEEFPMLIGQTVDEEVVDLPDAAKGKFTLIGVAYSKKSQDDFESWVNPVYNKFIAKTGMMDDLYDINTYFIALFSGAKKSAMESVMKRMKAKSDESIFPYVVFYKGDIGIYEDKLSLKDKNQAYVFLLNSAGKIVYSTSGKYSKNKMLEIEKLILDE